MKPLAGNSMVTFMLPWEQTAPPHAYDVMPASCFSGSYDYLYDYDATGCASSITSSTTVTAMFPEAAGLTDNGGMIENPAGGHEDEPAGFVISDYGYRYYNPELGRWINRDPIEERGGLNVYIFTGNDSVGNIDFLGLAFYAVGGTWERQSDGANPSWMRRMTREEPARYFRGPGFRFFGLIPDPSRAAHGRDTFRIAERVHREICKDFCEAKANCEDMDINMTGWSRGAMIVVRVAHLLNDKGCRCRTSFFGRERYQPVEVNWIGLFDAVRMVAEPGRIIGSPSRLPGTVPPNVKHFYHAVKTQDQAMFPTVIFGRNDVAFDNYGVSESSHKDIGHSARLGKNQAHLWIMNSARAAGVKF